VTLPAAASSNMKSGPKGGTRWAIDEKESTAPHGVFREKKGGFGITGKGKKRQKADYVLSSDKRWGRGGGPQHTRPCRGKEDAIALLEEEKPPLPYAKNETRTCG